MEHATCPRCGLEKPRAEFYDDKSKASATWQQVANALGLSGTGAAYNAVHGNPACGHKGSSAGRRLEKRGYTRHEARF